MLKDVRNTHNIEANTPKNNAPTVLSNVALSKLINCAGAIVVYIRTPTCLVFVSVAVERIPEKTKDDTKVEVKGERKGDERGKAAVTQKR
jgi:hypothetical protein